MGTIETFDHTADVGLRIRGSDLEAFLEARDTWGEEGKAVA